MKKIIIFTCFTIIIFGIGIYYGRYFEKKYITMNYGYYAALGDDAAKDKLESCCDTIEYFTPDIIAFQSQKQDSSNAKEDKEILNNANSNINDKDRTYYLFFLFDFIVANKHNNATTKTYCYSYLTDTTYWYQPNKAIINYANKYYKD